MFSSEKGDIVDIAVPVLNGEVWSVHPGMSLETPLLEGLKSEVLRLEKFALTL